MKVNSLTLRGHMATFVDWNDRDKGGKKKAHFYAANGYPVQVYEPLMKLLAQEFQLEALHNRAQWPNMGKPSKHIRWQTYANDLIHFLDARNTSSESAPIIGMGHSMGASSTIFAAAKRPDLFSQLILIEPAALTPTNSLLLKPIPQRIRRQFLQPGKATLKRRHRWQDRAELRSQLERWKSLDKIEQPALDSFANHLVIDKGEDVGLAFPREWEAHNFFNPSSIWSELKKVRCPITVIRSEAGIFFTDAMWAQWQKLRPQDRIEYIPNYGHLLPLQAPDLVAQKIITQL